MATYSSITINNQDIQARRLITPASRITLSNVCPTIPHGTLEIELKKLDLNLVSPVTFIKIGVSNPEYGHIFSFRRQVFTSPLSPESNIPESFTLTYENTLYRIFVSVDGLTCFKCKQPGHIAVNCCNAPSAPNSESPPKPSDKSSSSKKTTSTKDSVEASQSIVNSQNQHITNDLPSTPKKSEPAIKRTSSDRETPEIAEEENPTNNIFVTPEKPPQKKQRPDFDALLKPAKVFINSYKPPFVLNFDQLVDLFANSYGSPHPDQIAINYTNALPLLCYMLHEINPHLKDRSIKTRCTKLREKCEFFDSQPSTDNESDASSEVSSY